MTPRPRKTPPQGSGRAIGYLRVSTDEQRRSRLGLDAQSSSIKQAAARLGLNLTAVHRDEGISGSKPVDQRPGLLAAIADLRRGDVLIVAKRDRLSRGGVSHTAVIEAALRRKGARVISAAGEGTDGEEPQDEFFRDLTDSLAKMERKIIGKRTAAAMAEKQARGERISRHPPLGFRFVERGDKDAKGRPVVQLTADENEQEQLRVIADCRAAGYAWQKIADELARLGHKTRSGRPWTMWNVRAVYATAAKNGTIG